LANNDVITRDVIEKYQQMAVLRNYKIIANTAKGEEEGSHIVTKT
jgi:hypothetical protein